MNTKTKYERRLRLIKEAIARYGTYLNNYLWQLCKKSGIDHEVIYDDLFLYVLERFPEERILHIGFLRLKAFQLFCEAWRKLQRSPLVFVEDLQEMPHSKRPEILSEEEEKEFERCFYEEHPVNLTHHQKRILFMWARHGMTYEEISKEMNMPRSTVADHVKLGRDAIKKYLNHTIYSHYE